MLISTSPQPTEVRDAPTPRGAPVDIVVLTRDAALFGSIRSAVGDRHPAWRAPTSEEAVDMLLLGRCGVLIVDMAAVSTHPTSLVEQIHTQFPDVVVVVAGDRDDEVALSGLVGEGLIYRYMHKPLSEKRATMFLNAAIRHYTDRRGARDFAPLLPLMGRLPDNVQRRYWVIAGSVICAIVVAVAVMTHDREPRSQLLPAPGASGGTASAVGDAPRADPVLSRARAALDAGRYEAPAGRNALDLYQAVLLARPDNTEARNGLERTIDAILAAADAEWRSGDTAEAERMIARVLAVDPQHDAAQALLAQVHPSPPATAPVVAAVDEPSNTAPSGIDHDASGAKPEVMSVAPDSVAPDTSVAARPNPDVAEPAALVATVNAPVASPYSRRVVRGPVRKSEQTVQTAATATPRSTEPVAAAPVTLKSAAQKPAAPEPVVPTRVTSAPATSTTVASQPASTPSIMPTVVSAPSPKASTVAPEKPVVSMKPVPDPLQPKLAMSAPKYSRQRARAYGAPISSGLPVAGIDKRPYVAEPPARVASPAQSTESRSGNSRAARPEFVDASDLEQVVTIDPVYPAAAMRDRVEGWVTLEFTVTPAGGVGDILVTDSEPDGVFDAAATRAVSQWRFKPRVSGGRAVAMRSSVTLRFDVDQ